MKFTRVKTTVMAGLMAASMLAPGMTAFAADVQWPTIKKVVTAAEGVTLPTKNADGTDLMITFHVEQFDADGDTANGYTNGDGIKQAKQNVTAKNLSIKVSDLVSGKGYVSTEDIVKQCDVNGEYTFKITETSPIDKGRAEYGWIIDSKATGNNAYYLHVVVRDLKTDETDTYGTGKFYTFFVTTSNTLTEGGDSYNDKETIDKPDSADTDKKALFDVDNKYTKRGGSGTDEKGEDKGDASFAISKTVSGNSAAYAGDTFEFTVTFDTSNADIATVDSTGYSYKIGDGDATKVVSGGTIKLKNGETASFSDIPAGIKVTVVETKNDNTNKTKVTAVQNGTIVQTNEETLTAKTVTIGDKTNSVAFDNEYKDITPTGVVTSIAPYITLVVVAFAAVAAYVVIKRRVAR